MIGTRKGHAIDHAYNHIAQESAQKEVLLGPNSAPLWDGVRFESYSGEQVECLGFGECC